MFGPSIKMYQNLARAHNALTNEAHWLWLLKVFQAHKSHTNAHTHRIHTYMLVYSPHMHGQSDRARGAANLSESKLKQDNRSLVCFARSPSPASSSLAPPRLALPRLACSLCHSHTVVLIHTNLLAIIHCGLSCFELAALSSDFVIRCTELFIGYAQEGASIKGWVKGRERSE